MGAQSFAGERFRTPKIMNVTTKTPSASGGHKEKYFGFTIGGFIVY
jgi:hypothetical protein